MTSPLHGEGRAFESPRAHRFFFQSEAKIEPEGQVDADKKLCNSQKKLCNFGATSIGKSLTNMTDRYIDEEGNEQIEMLWDELAPEDGDKYDENDPYLLKAESKQRESIKQQREIEEKEQVKAVQAQRSLGFSKEELDQYADFRTKLIASKSRYWILRSAEMFWSSTQGEISQDTLNTLRNDVLEKYKSVDSHSKVLSFAKSFLEDLAMTRGEPRYQQFTPYMKPPKVIKERRRVTERIVTARDISNVLKHISEAERTGRISSERALQYSAIVLFGAYTGQRSEATIAKLTVGQFREALASERPVLEVDSSQDKIKMSHYVPLHPRVVQVLKPLLVGRADDELTFSYNSFLMWIKRQKIPMSRFKGHFVLGDLRKFAEQHGDIIQWDQSNRAYIMTHGVSGVEWAHYRHPLPEHVYDVYMRYWGDVRFGES